MQEISPIFESFFMSKLLIVWWRYNQMIRVMSKKLPTLPRGSLSIKCLNLSVARFVNAATKKKKKKTKKKKKKKNDKVGIDCSLWKV